jgi:hypothetical protein
VQSYLSYTAVYIRYTTLQSVTVFTVTVAIHIRCHTLHDTMLCYVTWRCTMLRCHTLHDTMLCYVTWRCTMLRYHTLHDTMLCYVTWRCTMLHCITYTAVQYNVWSCSVSSLNGCSVVPWQKHTYQHVCTCMPDWKYMEYRFL